jgi:HEAT repeat protein
MSFFSKLFSADEGPSERQIRRGIKQVTQTHGEAATRVAAMERLSSWKTAEAAAALLRRFTVQVPQASMDLEEKQYTVQLLVHMGRSATEPILQYLRTEPDVTWPLRALREILPPAEYQAALKDLLENMAGEYTRWPEAKTVMIQHIPDEASPEFQSTVLRFLDDDDDDVCIAAVDYLAKNGGEEVREKLIDTFLNAEARPRVRGRILDQLCEKEWPVKGYRKKVEEVISDPFYLTAKGTVKRRSV